MAKPFAPLAQQHGRVAAKVVAALERLGRVLVALHGRAGLREGLTSLQVFLLLELSGSSELGVRELAARFALSRATVSRSLALLQKKQLVAAVRHPEDRRRVVFSLTHRGQEMVVLLAAPLGNVLASVEALPQGQQISLWESLLALLVHWEQAGFMAAAKTCPTCRFFRRAPGEALAFCELLSRPLTAAQLRLDCPDHQGVPREPGRAPQKMARRRGGL